MNQKIRSRIILNIIALTAWTGLGVYCLQAKPMLWMVGTILGFAMAAVTLCMLAFLVFVDHKLRMSTQVMPLMRQSVLELADWYATRTDIQTIPGISELQRKLSKEIIQFRTDNRIGPGITMKTMSAMDQLTGEKHALVLDCYLDELMEHPEHSQTVTEAYRRKQQEIS
ncbi:hypothetical protein [Bifidobacterium callitrichidarum]|uniref:Uncharacterized protein n=1 Tax=Bifidobacterium callitrichidarum TaxID=2052941 RepID=A0A2U2NC48_9BIFI|nr:hypothetical protein [Bifidobacterium callitrichidarum]PWG66667.1 hypothetical protein DF196_01835 [Bifidobacterium callitrichidarum]